MNTEITKLFCGPKATLVTSFLLPLFPFNLLNIVVYLAFLLSFYYGPSNSFVNGTDKSLEKSWGTAAAWAFLAYYITMVIINIFIIKSQCRNV